MREDFLHGESVERGCTRRKTRDNFITRGQSENRMGKDSVNPDNVVLSYYDCLLRESDVALLKGPHWLNDVLIGFYFEYLDNKINENADPEGKEFLFISPELTQLLKLTDPSQYAIFLGSVCASSSTFVFFPLNNCEKKDSAGGSHWSLLVYSKPEQRCFHYDSSSGFNSSVAREFAKNISSYFLGMLETCVEVPCPQQENSYDCGIYVLCYTDVILEHVKNKKALSGYDCSGAKSLVPLKRSELLSLIQELKTAHSS